MDPITYADVVEAHATIANDVHRTPVHTSSLLAERLGVRLHLKAELFQKTGSFKPRGALNRIRRTPAAELEKGLISVSAGNHAQGLAWAARTVGAACTVVMPETAPPSKVEAARSYGAEVVLHETVAEIFDEMERIRVERDLVLVHPFDDPYVVAGQGTVGLEISEQVPDAECVVVPVGGGGLIGGVALAVKTANPGVRVIGVEPEGAAAMRDSLASGRPTRLEQITTQVDALAAPMAGRHGFELARRYVDEVVTLSDAEIVEGLREVMRYTKLFAERGGAASVAALLSGKIDLRSGERVVAIISGGNEDPSSLARVLAG